MKKIRNKRLVSVFFALFVFHSFTYAQILLPKVFSENMVLQRDIPIPIWGAGNSAWADNPVCNLINSEGLPAVPFRTDDWKELTQK